MGKRTVLERFWSKVQTQQSSCWVWTAAISEETGYGLFWDGTRLIGAHRFSYQLAYGPLPKDRPFVCHTCDNRACVNPAHLFAGSNRDNVRDCQDKGRWRKPYVPPAPRTRLTLEERFWRKVRRDEHGCWEWLGAGRIGGYGHFNVGKRFVGAHRLAYELTYGPIPQGIVVCHRCDNPRCVRPDHLFVGSARDNMSDCRDKGRLGDKRRLGLNNGATRITPELASLIREARAAGMSRPQLAKRYGISIVTITQITSNKHWTSALEAAEAPASSDVVK
jgi:hypothetical protein